MSETTNSGSTTELLCKQCGAWSPEGAWTGAAVYCEDCGEHEAVRCPACDHVVDTVMQELPERDVRNTARLPAASVDSAAAGMDSVWISRAQETHMAERPWARP